MPRASSSGGTIVLQASSRIRQRISAPWDLSAISASRLPRSARKTAALPNSTRMRGGQSSAWATGGAGSGGIRGMLDGGTETDALGGSDDAVDGAGGAG